VKQARQRNHAVNKVFWQAGSFIALLSCWLATTWRTRQGMGTVVVLPPEKASVPICLQGAYGEECDQYRSNSLPGSMPDGGKVT
jgi:hypothetical protein